LSKTSLKRVTHLLLAFLSFSVYSQKKPPEVGSSSSMQSQTVKTIFSNCDSYLFSNCVFLEKDDQYYSYFKEINDKECNSYVLDGYEMSLLKNELTSSIISLINTVSTNQFYFRDNKINKPKEKEIFNSVSNSYSNAILFNPKFTFCNNNGSKRIIIYVEKEKFDNDQKMFFNATIKRSKQVLRESEIFKIKNPNYQFVDELEQLNSFLNILRSFYSLMVTLEIDYKTLDEYLNLEQRVANFESSLNNLNNNLIQVDEYISNKNYTSAFNLIGELKLKFNDVEQRKILFQKQKEYLDLVRFEKNRRKKEYKNNASSFNTFSFDFNLNTALVNNSTNSSGELNYTDNSPFDRVYPALGVKFVFNDRDKTWGLGPYYKQHFSNSLISLNNIEYYFPFSNNFSEAGIWGQYFINSTSITFSAAKLLGRYQDMNQSALNFWTFSPGFKIEFEKTSYYASLILTRANSEYSFNGFSFGISYDLKLNRKISDTQLRNLEKEFPDNF
jgi:hypothetical protein